MGRLEDWKKRLLDLTFRNNFINFKTTTAIRVITKNLSELEDSLENDNTFDLVSKESLINEDENFSPCNKDEEFLNLFNKKDTLILDTEENEANKKLKYLYKKNRTFVQEKGEYNLFLTLGILNYHDKKRNKLAKAPLILVPISLYRESINKPFKLKKHSSDSKFNVTLIRFLKNNFNIDISELEKDLPKDDSGIDVNQIFNQIDAKIKEQNNQDWFIDRNQCYIGFFSFKKILMYKDIENFLIEDNLVLQYLDDPIKYKENIRSFHSQFESNLIEDKELDQKIHPKDVYLPADYDTSQLQAVLQAEKGSNFILQGPPGTGKSQTITNMIAHLLSKGKKVLFIAEKLVALNVVKKRLDDLGIGNFCLELHSDKSNKKDLSQKLLDNHNSLKKDDLSNWEKKCRELKRKRDELNGYINFLHEEQSSGFTAFKSMGTIIQTINKCENIEFDLESSEFENETLEDIQNLIQDLQTEIKNLDYKIHNNPLNGIGIEQWHPSLEEKIIEKSNEILKTLESLIPLFDEFENIFSFKSKELINEYDFRHFHIKALPQLKKVKDKRKYAYLLFHKDFKNIKKYLKESIVYNNRIQTSEKNLSVKYKKNLDINKILKLKKDFENFNRNNFFVRIIPQQIIVNKIKEFTLDNKRIKMKCFIGDITNLKNIYDSKNRIIELSKSMLPITNMLPMSYINWDEISFFLNWYDEMRKILNGFSNLYFHECVEEILINNQIDIDYLSTLASNLSKDYLYLRNILNDCKKSNIDFIVPEFINNKEQVLFLKKMCENRKENLHYLRNWIRYDKFRKKLLSFKKFEKFIKYIENEKSDLRNLKTTFEYNFHKKWYNCLYRDNKILNKDGSELNDLIQKIKQLNKEILQLSKKKVKSKILENISQVDTTDLSFLKRESLKKKKHAPIRTFYLEHSNMMQSLAPCLLMSPLSVAQYLPVNQVSFDVVIFDEASQIPPWDAIGSMARASQVIVIGDRKQLPPTSFFETGENEDFENKTEQDDTLDSILTECEALDFSELSLEYHYRSRHESLIAFSNKKYYGGKLITFPTNKINKNNTAIIIEKIKKGEFETETNTSKAEAEAIVDQVSNWLSDPNFKSSIGIVTFNKEQRDLIEKLMEQKRIENKKIDKFFSSNSKEEPVIIKNLENIQGDERDIIIFSIGFGSVGNKPLSMNFGAINKDGGEKRLNVAITRSREKMYIYTGIDYTMIDKNKTRATGMLHLKHFLEYAEKGPKALFNDIRGSVGDYDSPFEKEVSEVLKSLGYNVEPQVGVGRYRIDIGVKHPDEGGRYLAGIECDGASYHSTATARDRDCTRQGILEDLGWKILRIWSTDWWANKEKETKRIDEKLKNLLLKDKPNTTI